MKNDMTSPSDQIIADFERALAELEALVSKMEQGDLSLADTIRSFERGSDLAKRCKVALDQAQLRVDTLLEGKDNPVPFDPDAQ